MTVHDASTPTATCALGIANIGVQLRCTDEQIAGALCRRYQAFPLRHAAQLTLDVVITDERPHGEIEVIIDDCAVRDAAVPDRSWIDVQQGYGRVIVPPTHALELIEYWLRVAYALLIFRAGGLLFHAAGIVRGDRAFLFCGCSGSGKTTVARLSPNDLVLNDDLVVLLPHAGGWIAHATPFSNPTQVQPTGPHNAPIAAVLRLVQAKTVALQPVSGALALAELISNVPVLSADPASSAAVFQRCHQLLNTLPMFYLHFLPDASFWPVVEHVVPHMPNLV